MSIDVVDRILRREPEALAYLARLRVEATTGDRAAARMLATTATVYHRRRRPQLFNETAILFRGLQQRAPTAKARLDDVLNLARAGDQTSRLRLDILRSLSKTTVSAPPGAPQIGYHPMPYRQRPGIMFGASNLPFGVDPGLLGAQAQGWLGQAAPGLGIPLGGLPVPSVVYQVPGFPPVTPQILFELLSLIQRALLSGQGLDRAASPYVEVAPDNGGLAQASSYDRAKSYAAPANPTPSAPGMFNPAGRTLVQSANVRLPTAARTASDLGILRATRQPGDP